MKELRMPPRLFFALALTLAPIAARAAPPARDPDWPCPQILVAKLSPANYWSGPLAQAAADWHAEPKLADLIDAVSPRGVATAAGTSRLAAFADQVPQDARARVLPLLFAGLVDRTNEERDVIITRIKELGARQRALAKRIEADEARLQQLPENATGDTAAERAGIIERHDLLVRSYHDIGATLGYACQVPSDLDARLGAYAQTLAARLPAAHQ
jgi:hypothetical protein